MSNTIASDTLVEAIARAMPDRAGYVYRKQAARAALTAITEAGYVLAPMEPTPEMIEAGCAAYWPMAEFAKGPLTNGDRTTRCWNAMINAVTHCNNTNNGKAE